MSTRDLELSAVRAEILNYIERKRDVIKHNVNQMDCSALNYSGEWPQTEEHESTSEDEWSSGSSPNPRGAPKQKGKVKARAIKEKAKAFKVIATGLRLGAFSTKQHPERCLHEGVSGLTRHSRADVH